MMKSHIFFAAAIAATALVSSCCSQPEAKGPETFSVIPQPVSVVEHEGSFNLAGASFTVDTNICKCAQSVIEEFANNLSTVSGKKSKLALAEPDSETPASGVIFLLNNNLGAEGYAITATEESLQVEAGGYNGFLYAIQTLRQMLPDTIFGTKKVAGDYSIPCVEIFDYPRFAYRGMHLDVCRHFYTVDEVKKILNLMAIHKMNRFHWHLTEDQGWRVEIKKYPLLTEVGSVRNGTQVGGDFDKTDDVPYGPYFYTQEELKDVVAYAQKLGITIIPEIDLPGHMVAALTAYPELGCTGGPYEVRQTWGIADDVLCPGKDKTFEFIFDVLDEICEIFPSETINIGGDECPKVRWDNCPDCQARIKALGIKPKNGLTTGQQLQAYVTHEVQKHLEAKGRKIIGWDEILEGDLDEGATVLVWRANSSGAEAAARGYDVVMVPSQHLYFDYYQSTEHDLEPYAIGGNYRWASDNDIEDVYTYEPVDGMTEAEAAHVLGVQANLWTEYIKTVDYLEYMLLPRMTALSEIQWCPQGTRDFERFKLSLENMRKVYERLGFNYCQVLWGVHGGEGLPEPAVVTD